MIQPTVMFAGLGSCVPSRLVTNADFEKVLETSDTWIQERTGIKQRYFAGPGETTSGMARDASLKALADAKLEPMDLDLIVGATASPDRLLPSIACDVQALIGARNAAAFDVIEVNDSYAYQLPMWIEGLGVCADGLDRGVQQQLRPVETVLVSGLQHLFRAKIEEEPYDRDTMFLRVLE
jgi:hypothetical protein